MIHIVRKLQKVIRLIVITFKKSTSDVVVLKAGGVIYQVLNRSKSKLLLYLLKDYW